MFECRSACRPAQDGVFKGRSLDHPVQRPISSRPHFRLFKTSATGFSLVELLVAISIIAMLAVLCFPGFKSALIRANLGQSCSNLRQIQAANILYSADHDGYYVPIASRDAAGVLERWMDHQPFLDYFGLQKGDPWPAKLVSPSTAIRDSKGNKRIDRSYGMNYTGMTGLEVYGSKWQLKTVRVRYPAQTIACADATDWIIDFYQAGAYKGAPEVYTLHAMAYRYAGKAGVAFYDGHVEALTMSEVLAAPKAWSFE